MPPDLPALEAARDQAVRDLANHIQPAHCPGCRVCDTLWLLIAGAEHQIEDVAAPATPPRTPPGQPPSHRYAAQGGD